MTFPFGEPTPEQRAAYEQAQETRKLQIVSHEHTLLGIFERCNPDELMVLAAEFQHAARHPHEAWELSGKIQGLASSKPTIGGGHICLGCGVDHDKEDFAGLTEPSTSQNVLDPSAFREAGTVDATKVSGDELKNFVENTHRADAEPPKKAYEAPSLIEVKPGEWYDDGSGMTKEEYDAKMVEYNLEVSSVGGELRLRCKTCKYPAVSLEDRMLKGPDECVGCQMIQSGKA